ncbi:MAG: iron-sulfur cluster assembly scaffold protein [Planctomycetota bacterium]
MMGPVSDDSDDKDRFEEHVLDHYEDPYNRGRLANRTHSAEGQSPICDEVLRVDLKLDDAGVVEEAFFEGETCLVCLASASMLAEKAEGQSVEELEDFSEDEMIELYGGKLKPELQKCCLFPWKVLQTAIHAPIETDDWDECDGRPTFGGPTLGDES